MDRRSRGEHRTLGQRINRPGVQKPKVAVFTEERTTKYRSHRAIQPDVVMGIPSEVYPHRLAAEPAIMLPSGQASKILYGHDEHTI